jgi:hypothetical protein
MMFIRLNHLVNSVASLPLTIFVEKMFCSCGSAAWAVAGLRCFVSSPLPIRPQPFQPEQQFAAAGFHRRGAGASGLVEQFKYFGTQIGSLFRDIAKGLQRASAHNRTAVFEIIFEGRHGN